MSYKRQQGKKDANHSELVTTARKIGASVGETFGVGNSFPDLIAHLTETVLIEIKQPDGEFSIAQLRFLAEWKGFSGFASTSEEIINLLRDPKNYALTEKDKRTILRIVLKYENKTSAKYPRIAVKTFEKLFAEMKK